MPWFTQEGASLSRQQIEAISQRTLDEARSRLKVDFRRVLLLPPDLTRAHSGAGTIAEMFYKLLPSSCDTHVIPTLGQHRPHTPEENRWMFGEIPHSRIHVHDWRHGVTRVGVIPASVVKEKTGGKVDWEIPLDLNTMLMKQKWDLIINIGHVVPHEVLGFANHNKNYFIGLGGKETLCAVHMASATWGIENNLGNLITPTRACFNWAEERFLKHLPDCYLQIVMNRDQNTKLVTSGIYVGDDVETYISAARASKRQNITIFEKPVKKIVAVMQADEFRSTWVANKAIYRTRLALADGGELLIIAPGLERFGEQPDVDALIRKYGYCGSSRCMELYRINQDMQELAHGTAHLLHGSSEGRFRIRYAPGHLSKAEIEGVHFEYADLRQTLERYQPDAMKEGWNRMADGEEVFFISTPSAGLWATRARLEAQAVAPGGVQ
jgi:nickel-dependent lactate racemase